MKRTAIAAVMSSIAILAGCSQPSQDAWRVDADATDRERRLALETAQPFDLQDTTEGTYSFPSRITNAIFDPASGPQSVEFEVRDDTLYIRDQQPLVDGTAVLGVRLEDGSTYVAGNPDVFTIEQ